MDKVSSIPASCATRRLSKWSVALAAIVIASLQVGAKAHEHEEHHWESPEVRSELGLQIGGIICVWIIGAGVNRVIGRKRRIDS